MTTGINLVYTALYIITTIFATLSVSKSHRWKVLLVVCLLFYYILIGSKIWIILGLSVIIYFFSHAIQSRKGAIWISLVLLLIPLLIFKSSGIGNHFDNYEIGTLDTSVWNNWTSLFQITGLSYLIFNSISYLVDIRRKYITPEKNYFFLLLYLSYFPIIFSGPLHRASYLFEKFKNIEINEASVTRGLRLILWGIFKNVVIAQRTFMLIEQLQTSDISGAYYLLIGLLFFLYLYCNFSSFIDFFRGVSQILNINLKENFKNRIYFSASRQEFWKGWHITLNEWFRDYFFFVISRFDRKRRYTDILLLTTFLLIALWHGFSTMLLIWGLLNGLWIVIERKFHLKTWNYPSFRRWAGVIYHLTISSLLALVFISSDLGLICEKIFSQPSQLPADFVESYLVKIIVIVSYFGIMDYHYFKAGNLGFDDYLGSKSQASRWFIYFKLIMIILVFGRSTGVENYYIQF